LDRIIKLDFSKFPTPANNFYSRNGHQTINLNNKTITTEGLEERKSFESLNDIPEEDLVPTIPPKRSVRDLFRIRPHKS
jgi:hypothetical protein